VRLEKTEDKFSPSIGVFFTDSNEAALLTSLEQLCRSRNLTLQSRRKEGRFKGGNGLPQMACKK